MSSSAIYTFHFLIFENEHLSTLIPTEPKGDSQIERVTKRRGKKRDAQKGERKKGKNQGKGHN
jgi:hypothetical protein